MQGNDTEASLIFEGQACTYGRGHSRRNSHCDPDMWHQGIPWAQYVKNTLRPQMIGWVRQMQEQVQRGAQFGSNLSYDQWMDMHGPTLEYGAARDSKYQLSQARVMYALDITVIGEIIQGNAEDVKDVDLRTSTTYDQVQRLRQTVGWDVSWVVG